MSSTKTETGAPTISGTTRTPLQPVAHFTVDSVQLGARRPGPRFRGRLTPTVEAAGRPSRSGRVARGAGEDAGGGARADSVRADAGLAVHVLSGGGLHHGRRSRGHAADRALSCSCAATRASRTSGSTRPLTGVLCSTRTTSTRRCRARFEWDVKRLVASFAVAGRDRGFGDRHRQAIGLTVGRSYREAMASFAAMRMIDIWYSRVDIEDIVARFSSEMRGKVVKRAERSVAKARTKDSLAAFKKLTRVVDGEPRIVSNPPLIVPVSELFTGEQELEAAHLVVHEYRRTLLGDRRHLLERFRLADAARKVVGVGECGNEGVHLALPRPRRRGSAVPSDEGGGGVRAGAVPRQERVRQPRPAGGRGSAADAGRERHDARLDPRHGRRRRRAGLLPAPALGLEGIGAGRRDGAKNDGGVRGDLRQALAREHTPAPATRSRSRATSGRATRSTVRSRSSPRRMPTRTSATTRRSRLPPTRARIEVGKAECDGSAPARRVQEIESSL